MARDSLPTPPDGSFVRDGERFIPVPADQVDASVTRDHLVGDWDIYQLAQGHRFSDDDALIAWTAARESPRASTLLDLGSGIGAIGLLTLYRVGGDSPALACVEIQEVSHRLCRRTVEHNDLARRVELRLGDLRDRGVIPEEAHFDLITACPPYVPHGRGRVPPHPQRAAARVALNGDVFDYCCAAARALRRDGVFVLGHPDTDSRVERAIESAGLTLRRRQEVVSMPGRRPHMVLFSCGFGGQRRDAPAFAYRHEDGRFTEARQGMMQDMVGTRLKGTRPGTSSRTL